jgi:polyhydroxyalkanoate synthesis repressor PhaR
MRVVKRYSNRRLYDTQSSRTLTQTELASLIKDGLEVKVVDAATGKDITVAVLGRIVLAEAPTWGDVKKSKELFTKIIEIGGSKSMSILKNTVLASIGALHVTKEKAEKIIDDLIKRGELDESQRKKAVMELLDKAEKSTAGIREKISKEVGKAQKEISRLAKEVKEYKLVKRADLQKLEGKVDKLTEAITKLEKQLSEK